MKRIILLFVFLLSGFLFTPPSFANNFLSNPGFENDFQGWTVIGANWQAQNIVVNEGLVSVKNTIAIGTVDYFAAVQQTITVTSTKLYAKLNIKATLPATSLARAGVLLVFKNNANVEVGRAQDIIGGTTGWRTLFIDATVPAGATKVDFQAFVFTPRTDTIANGGQIYFDAAILSQDPLTGYQTGLINGDFENGTSDWNEFSYDIPAVAVTTPVQEGALAAKKVINTAGGEYFGQIFQDIYYDTAGTLYPADTFVNARGFVSPAINPIKRTVTGVKLEYLNASGTVLDSVQKVVEGTSGYRDLYVFGTTPTGTKVVRVSNIIYANAADAPAGGTVYLDNFLFSRTPLTGYPTQEIKLINGNFENGLSDWSDQFFPAAVNATVFHSGNYSAQLTVTNAVLNQNYYSEIAKTIDVTSGKIIQRARVFAKSASKTAVGEFRLEFLNAAGAVIVSATRTRSITGTTNWQELYLTNITVPRKAVKMRVICSLFAPQGSNSVNDTVYFDDALISYALIISVNQSK
ncbi:MAG: hypothetical protein KBD53_10245 [Candidatus Omnitrophica bacterium]|nr:hypothetical protein [Candidatus Omnitrophota bacterium]